MLDTNILIYLLSGNNAVRELVDGSTWFISFISEIELLMKSDLTETEQQSIHALIRECHVIEMNQAIKELAIVNGQKHRLKLADSIILASSQSYQIPLLTADLEFNKANSSDSDILIFKP